MSFRLLRPRLTPFGPPEPSRPDDDVRTGRDRRQRPRRLGRRRLFSFSDPRSGGRILCDESGRGQRQRCGRSSSYTKCCSIGAMREPSRHPTGSSWPLLLVRFDTLVRGGRGLCSAYERGGDAAAGDRGFRTVEERHGRSRRSLLARSSILIRDVSTVAWHAKTKATDVALISPCGDEASVTSITVKQRALRV